MNNRLGLLTSLGLLALVAVALVGCGGGGGGLPPIVALTIAPDDFAAQTGDVIQFHAFGWQTNITVYVTETGEKYHRGSCQYLKESKIPITLSKAIQQGYEPCSVCEPPGLGDAGAREVTDEATWQASDLSVGTVGPGGEFKARGPGQVEVSATYGTIASEATPVTVTDPGAQPVFEYYPLGLNYLWTYEGTPVTPAGVGPRQSVSMTVSVPRQAVIEGQVWFELQVKGTDPQVPPGYMYLRHDADGLAEFVGGAQPIYRLMAPLQVHQRWTDPYDPLAYFFIEATDDTVTVPAGTYANCVQVWEHRVTQAQIEYDVYTWFAPGVGPVLSRFPEDDPNTGETTWVEQRLVQVQLELP